MIGLLIGGFVAREPLRIRIADLVYERRLGLSDVVAAATALPFRTITARIAGRFPYRPTAARRRGLDSQVSPLVYAAAQRYSDLHGQGVAQLLIGDRKNACTSLERAAMSATHESNIALATERLDDARLLGDLAAAYFERGDTENRTDMILAAIDAASHALRIDSSLASALFTRALAIERIHTLSQAVRAWDDYLQIDPDSDWAAEARAHEQALTKRSKSSAISPESLAKHIETELLPDWADSYLRGDTLEAARVLRQASQEAAALDRCCGNDFLTRSIDAVDYSVRHDRQNALRLATAHQQYRDGNRLYAENRTSAALTLFESSRNAFRDDKDIFALKPWKYLAASHVYLGNGQQAAKEADEAARFCSEHGCQAAALAHLRWVQAAAAGRAGDPQRAIAYYEEALSGFEGAKELDNAASVHALIAENMEFLGAGEEAWPHRQVALRLAERNGTLDRVYIAFNEAADAAFRCGHFTSARLFQDIVVDAARRENNDVLLADALLWRGRIANAAGDRTAIADWDEAERIASHATDPQRRDRLAANIASARATASAPAEAIDQLTRALDFFTRAENHYRLAELYAARAEAEEKLSRSPLAEADYRRCIEELESDRRSVTNPALRDSFFATGSGVFDRAIHHLWVHGLREDAFRLAEQSRGRALLGAARPPSSNTSDIGKALRPGDVVVEYALLADRLIIWIIKPSTSKAIDRPLTERALTEAIAAMDSAFEQGAGVDAAIDRLSAFLYAPVAAEVNDATRIIVVANKVLRAVPFAALRDITARKYLIEERQIVVAPSAAAYVRALERGRSLQPAKRPSILLVSYTAGDEVRKLPSLRSGAAEIEAVRALYGLAEVVSGQQATPLRVLSRARSAMTIHVVAHSVYNPEHPEFASILLASSTEGRDLYARDIAAASFPSARVVFLSSCGTPGRLTSNDASLTLPESFLSAGVPVVISALRPVEDTATASLAAAFHQEFAVTGDAVAALRSAQLKILASPGADVRFWSSWTAIGGGA